MEHTNESIFFLFGARAHWCALYVYTARENVMKYYVIL